MPLAVTVFTVPTFLSENVAVPLTEKVSPEIRVSPYVTDATSFPSYVLDVGVMEIVTDLRVISAVVVGAPTMDKV